MLWLTEVHRVQAVMCCIHKLRLARSEGQLLEAGTHSQIENLNGVY